MYVQANQPLVETLANAWDFQIQDVQQQLIQGGYFDFQLVNPNTGDIFGNIGYGPNGPNWDTNGSPAINPYVPGTFGSSDIDSVLPVLKRGYEPIKPSTFRKRYLAGMDAAFDFLGEEFENTFRFYWQISLGDLESRLGMFIWPRVIICDGIERGFRPGVDFDVEER